ncbi:MAG TPA: hypothetical protein PLK77_06450 [Pyrinomonadaceae bacterium]|nr:hypothetical protein [Pyrinomonadaceae bacterium]
MRRITPLLAVAFAAFVLCSVSYGQGFYQMSSGSYMTGYGQVYGSFGYAMATQNMYNTMQNIMQTSSYCKSMERQFGRAKTLSADPKCAQYLKGTSPSGTAAGTAPARTASAAASANNVLPTPKYYGRYRPDPTVNMAVTISNTLFETPEERAQLKQVIEVINAAYKKEAAAKGWSNNFASGMTFFIVAMSTVYNDSEPNDETVKAIYEAVNQTIDGVPDFAKASNKDKTTINDMLVGFSALPLATYVQAKQNSDMESLKTAQALAGAMIKLVLKTEPDKLKF